MRDLETAERTQAVSEQALELLHRHRALPSPENYELWFVYATGRNDELTRALDKAVIDGSASDAVHTRNLHARFFAPASKTAFEEVGNQLDAEIKKLTVALEGAGGDTAAYSKTLKTAGDELGRSELLPQIKTVLEHVTAATRHMEARNKSLETELRTSMREVDILRGRMETVRHESLSDVLTGLANRRCFDERMREAAAEATAQGKPLCIAMGDIDHFKRFNDTWGHAIGDQVLRLVAQCFKSSVRECDIAARYGGEEFVVILPGASLEDASVVAGKIRRSVETKKIVKRGTSETLGSITLSLGVAQLAPGEAIADLINRADACLYAAKRAGRNRVLTEDAAHFEPS